MQNKNHVAIYNQRRNMRFADSPQLRPNFPAQHALRAGFLLGADHG